MQRSGYYLEIFVFRVENGIYYNKQSKAFSCPNCRELVCRKLTSSVFFIYHLRLVATVVAN